MMWRRQLQRFRWIPSVTLYSSPRLDILGGELDAPWQNWKRRRKMKKGMEKTKRLTVNWGKTGTKRTGKIEAGHFTWNLNGLILSINTIWLTDTSTFSLIDSSIKISYSSFISWHSYSFNDIEQIQFETNTMSWIENEHESIISFSVLDERWLYCPGRDPAGNGLALVRWGHNKNIARIANLPYWQSQSF